MDNDKGLPQDIVDLWPEVFNSIKMNVVPLHYVHAVELTLKNKKKFRVKLKSTHTLADPSIVKSELRDIVLKHRTQITNMDLKLDADRIKHDISKSTKNFLKKNLM